MSPAPPAPAPTPHAPLSLNPPPAADAPATVATVPTPTGPFSVIAARDDDGAEFVLASGWTDDPDELLLLVHRSLRPESVTPGTPAALDAVEAYLGGDMAAID